MSEAPEQKHGKEYPNVLTAAHRRLSRRASAMTMGIAGLDRRVRVRVVYGH